MPKITPVPFRLTKINDGDRSDGVHVSSQVRGIALELGHLDPKWADEGKDDTFTRLSLGLAWEDWVFPKQHPEVAYHPGEIVTELTGRSLAGTCDGVSWVGKDDGKLRIHECKLTWKSMKKGDILEGEWMWLAQTMTYCKQWDTNLARYHIFWVNGNYKYGTPEGEPNYKLYDLEFTAREIRENWQMITNYNRETK